MNIIKKILFIFIAVVICSCNDSDDIAEIFMNKTWKLSFIQEGTERVNAKDGYTMIFYENVFAISTPNGSDITGRWTVDNESRRLQCSEIKTNGNISNDATAVKMEIILKKATHYEGDANWLQIKQTDNIYMQFHNR